MLSPHMHILFQKILKIYVTPKQKKEGLFVVGWCVSMATMELVGSKVLLAGAAGYTLNTVENRRT
jgi:PII-like signaling protein